MIHIPVNLYYKVIDIFSRPHRPQGKMNKKEHWELRSVVAVFRHADRTPKQKMKMKITEKSYLQFFDNQKSSKKEIKLKTPHKLQV